MVTEHEQGKKVMEEKLLPPRATRAEIEEDLEPPLREGGKVKFNFGSGIFTSIMLSVAITVALIQGMVALGVSGLVSKKDFTENLGNISNTLTQLSTTLTNQKNQVDAAIQDIPDRINSALNGIPATVDSSVKEATTQLNQQISNVNNVAQANANSLGTLNNQLAEAREEVVGLTDKLDSADEKIASLEIQLADYEARIASLETSGETSTPSSAVVVGVKTIGNTIMPTSDTSMSGGMKVTLTNTTNATVEDIILDIFVQMNYGVPNSTSSLTGGGTVWQRMGFPSGNIVDFVNTQWGLSLKAGETKVLYLSYIITGTGTQFLIDYPYGVQFQVDVTVM